MVEAIVLLQNKKKIPEAAHCAIPRSLTVLGQDLLLQITNGGSTIEVEGEGVTCGGEEKKEA